MLPVLHFRLPELLGLGRCCRCCRRCWCCSCIGRRFCRSGLFSFGFLLGVLHCLVLGCVLSLWRCRRRCWSCSSRCCRCAGLSEHWQSQGGEECCDDDGFRVHGNFLKKRSFFSLGAECCALLPLTSREPKRRHQSVSKDAIFVSVCCCLFAMQTASRVNRTSRPGR